MLFEPTAKPRGKSLLTHRDFSGFAFSSQLWTEPFSRAQFQSMILGRVLAKPRFSPQHCLMDCSQKMESGLLCEPQNNLQMVVLVIFSYCGAGDGSKMVMWENSIWKQLEWKACEVILLPSFIRHRCT